jgi:hypothetical protein
MKGSGKIVLGRSMNRREEIILKWILRKLGGKM